MTDPKHHIDNLTTTVIPITVDNLPEGVWYEDDGSAWQAILDPAEPKGWRHQPCNWTAFGKGEPTGEMSPTYIPTDAEWLKQVRGD